MTGWSFPAFLCIVCDMYVCRVDMYILRGWPGRLAGLAEKGKKKTEVEKLCECCCFRAF